VNKSAQFLYEADKPLIYKGKDQIAEKTGTYKADACLATLGSVAGQATR
jgi:hypothetical protein